MKHPLARYWSNSEELARMNAEISDLAKARDELLYSELGLSKSSGERPPDSETKARMREASELYPRVLLSLDSTEDEKQRARVNRASRLEYLSHYLTPEELLDYRMNQDGASGAVDALLRVINPTEEEFKRVFLALDGEDLRRTNGGLRPDLEARLREALGEERYAAYREEWLPTNEFLHYLSYRFDFSADQLQQLKALQKRSSELSEVDYRRGIRDILNNPAAEAAFFADPRARPPQTNLRPRPTPNQR